MKMACLKMSGLRQMSVFRLLTAPRRLMEKRMRHGR